MNVIISVFAVLICISAAAIILCAFYSGKPIRRLLVNSIIGFAVFAAINLTSKFTGIRIYVNPITVVGTAMFSVPAVIGLLLLNVIFI